MCIIIQVYLPVNVNSRITNIVRMGLRCVTKRSEALSNIFFYLCQISSNRELIVTIGHSIYFASRLPRVQTTALRESFLQCLTK